MLSYQTTWSYDTFPSLLVGNRSYCVWLPCCVRSLHLRSKWQAAQFWNVILKIYYTQKNITFIFTLSADCRPEEYKCHNVFGFRVSKRRCLEKPFFGFWTRKYTPWTVSNTNTSESISESNTVISAVFYLSHLLFLGSVIWFQFLRIKEQGGLLRAVILQWCSETSHWRRNKKHFIH